MISEIPYQERPRERCLSYGPNSLSLRECIAILLGSGPRGKGCMGLASEILRDKAAITDLGELKDGSLAEKYFLQQWINTGPALFNDIPGLGPAQKVKLQVCFEIAKRLGHLMISSELVPDSLELSTIEKEVLNQISQEHRSSLTEWFGFVGVFKTGKLTPLKILAKSSSNQVIVDQQKLFLEILLIGTPGFVLVHNHPTGDLIPSQDDRELTKSVQKTAENLGLSCISHIIVTAKNAKSVSTLH